jgi:hypothetical protein
MAKGFGGEILRTTLMEKRDGYLGLHHNPENPRMVKIGLEQTLVYSSNDDLKYGPFHL